MSLYVVLGAGVVGLTTALELQARFTDSRVVIIAKYVPGDRSVNYASPWAGANWHSEAKDNGREERWDEITYRKFDKLADSVIESGIKKMKLISFFDGLEEDVDILTPQTGKIWYEELASLRRLAKHELPQGAKFGFDMDTFQINVQTYLSWLQIENLKHGAEIHRASMESIKEVSERFPEAKAVFNCTGLGSYSLSGVEDRKLTPVRGQVLLVENPAGAIQSMYERKSKCGLGNSTYVYPRGNSGGIILGGSRDVGSWEEKVNMELAEDIKRRCCALCPGLGSPDSLKVIAHGVGLRPSRKGGPRIERETINGSLIIHNYGAGGSGYQASWQVCPILRRHVLISDVRGMAKEAVDLL